MIIAVVFVSDCVVFAPLRDSLVWLWSVFIEFWLGTSHIALSLRKNVKQCSTFGEESRWRHKINKNVTTTVTHDAARLALISFFHFCLLQNKTSICLRRWRCFHELISHVVCEHIHYISWQRLILAQFNDHFRIVYQAIVKNIHRT